MPMQKLSNYIQEKVSVVEPKNSVVVGSENTIQLKHKIEKFKMAIRNMCRDHKQDKN